MILPRFVQSRLLRSVPGAYHAFLGIDPEPGRGTSRVLREVFAVPPSRIATARQIHSVEAIEAGWEELGLTVEGKREADALWTVRPGTGVGVRTADCVPVLLASPRVPLAVAVHAGWRGLAGGILGETLRRVAEGTGAGRDELVAAVGPCARGCCYEVGEEVSGRLAGRPGASRHLARGKAPGKWMADLAGIALAELDREGIGPSRREAVGSCTVCSPFFHSYRREKALTGRQLSFIYLLEAGPVAIPPETASSVPERP